MLEFQTATEQDTAAFGRALAPIVDAMREYGREWLGAADTCDEASADFLKVPGS